MYSTTIKDIQAYYLRQGAKFCNRTGQQSTKLDFVLVPKSKTLFI